MNTATMKNWGIENDQTGFKAPETVRHFLVGEIHGDSAERFQDGERIKTSAIRDIVNHGDHKTIETGSTKYVVYPEDIDPEYEKAYPGTYERLGMSGG